MMDSYWLLDMLTVFGQTSFQQHFYLRGKHDPYNNIFRVTEDDSKSMSTYMGLFHAERVGNSLLCTFTLLTGAVKSSSVSSLCRGASKDTPDPLSPPASIVHCSLEVFKATSCIDIELFYIVSCWLSCLCSSL